jgi:2-methylcitrate dehydratase PrpD
LITQQLGRLIAETQYSDLPSDVVETAKSRLLDYLGVIVAGYRIGAYLSIINIFQQSGECTILCHGRRTSMRDAVVVNGFMAHSTWYEDGSRVTGGHPSTAILPSLIALAEARRYSGKSLIVSMVVGYECFNRIGMPMYPAAVRRGFQPTAILAPLAAAAACGKIMNLNADKISQAMNIAAPLGAGLKSAFKVGSTQPIQVARGSEAGLIAALLAEQNLEGYSQNLEAFLIAHELNPGSQINLKNWGIEFEIKNTYIKIHGGCRGNHAPLDVILDIVRGNNIHVADIASIQVAIDTVTAANEIHKPKNRNEAQFNIPFSIAVALVNGNASLTQYTEKNLLDPVVKALMTRVNIDVDFELDKLLPEKRGSKGKVLLKDGRSFENFRDMPQGEPEQPLSYEEIAEKFVSLAQSVLGKHTNEIIYRVSNLENLHTVNDLLEILTVSSPCAAKS